MIKFERPALLILLVLVWRACRHAAALSSLAGPLARAFRAQNIWRSTLRTPARDVEPDRLTAGKDAARRMAALLPGDGVGLVAAAGAHAVACPVTTDEGAFLLLLERLDAA
ncbi:MAG: hypothetical protein QGI33_02010 [Candidatus Brocadiia bacterium]|jgi:Ca-activated chloride channel family protein|nr:hypothetical protein [Candidatus Brocadiia bacterium]